MASVSSAHLVLFIAAILVFAGVAGTMTSSANRIAHAITEDSVDEAKQTNAEIRVISDPDSPSAVYNTSTDTLTLYVKNVGTNTIPWTPEHVAVLVNGTYQSDVRTTVLDADEWRPTTVLRVRVNVTLPSNAHTRVVVRTLGGRDLFTFTTP